MAITSVTIENFKSIGNAVTIPIRPITLLFGKNSSGKSTVLQAIRYGFEIFSRMLRNEPLDRVDIIRGLTDYTIRGDFSSLVHGSDSNQKILIRIEFSLPEGFINGEKRNSGWIEVTVGCNTNIEASGVVGLNGEELMCFEPKGITTKEKGQWVRLSKYSSLYWNTNHPSSDIKDDEKMGNIISFFSYIHDISYYSIYLGPIRSTPRPPKPKSSRYLKLENFMLEKFDDCMRIIFQEIRSMPSNIRDGFNILIRFLSNIFKEASEKKENYNRNLIPNILHLIEEKENLDREQFAMLSTSGYLYYYAFLTGDYGRKLLEEVNKYMKDIFELEYTMTKSNTDNIRLRDENKDIEVDLQDVGTGIGQVIPVIIGALFQLDKKSLLFSVEQPELHIHPALQVGLGDLFIDGIHRGEGRRMLIETHSEHLLLRLLRRVRETTEGKQADYTLTPDDLSVVYVRPTPEGTKFTPISVTDDGDFYAPWPEGFFDERVKELF